jgi:hypothetical protein
MALTALENRYLDSMAERQFPTLSPMESAQVMGEQQDAMPADAPMQLAAGPSATVSDADPYANRGYGEIKATPRNRVVGGIADFVRNVRSMADQYEIKDWVPLLGGMGVGELLIGKAPEEIEEWAYGNAPMRVPEMSNVPVMKTGRKEQLADTLFLGLDAAGIGKGVGVAGKGAARYVAPKANELLSEYMQRSGLQSNLMAYHGTPHRFDKFDSSKIGTGEGAQAYGHGLYFAESKDVADGYRISLAYNPDEMKVGGKQINEVYAEIDRAAGRKPPAQAQADYEKLEVLERLMMNEMPSDITDFVSGLAPETQQWFNKTVKPSFQTYGNLMTVDIPDEMVSKMLDWDKPLREQSQEIQRFALQNANALKAKIKSQQANPLNEGMVPESIYDLTGRELYAALQDTGKQTQELFKQRDALLAKYMTGNMSMSDAVRAMNPEDRAAFSRVADQIDGLKNAPREASNILREAGIPGVRYLDQGSREAGKGSRNIVVFPGGEDQIKIIKTEGTK